jgi:hypothetical protein
MSTTQTTTRNATFMEYPDPVNESTTEPDSAWLMARVELIDPNVFDLGNDGAYTRALERLAVQLRDELATATGMVKQHIATTGSGCACRLKGQAYCEKHDS